MRFFRYVVFSAVLYFVFQDSAAWGNTKLDSKVDHALNFARQQLKKTISSLNNDTNQFPEEAILGEDIVWKTKNMNGWGSGYFPGMLWYMYEDTTDDFWKQKAQAWTISLENEKSNISHHDIGLIIGCSFGHAYRLTNDRYYREVVAEAANSLARRFNPAVGCTRSWGKIDNDKTFTVIIDNMVCTELLFMGAKLGGQKQWYDMAVSHALKTMENHIRSDSSTYHVVEYNPVKGGVIQKRSHQGFAEESCWARGQAWAIYGFTTTFRETGNEVFLKTAQKAADYFINNLPKDYVPYWDFRLPDIQKAKRDTSAAAIAASGMLELSTLTKDEQASKKYFDMACSILNALCSTPYLAEGTKSPAILLQMTYGVKDATDDKLIGSWIWGDYYFVEAMMRYKRIAQKQTISYTLSNPLDLARTDELITIPLYKLKTKGHINFIVRCDDKMLPSQLEDRNLDGEPDAISFLVDIGPKQQLNGSIESICGRYPFVANRAHAEISVKSDLPEAKGLGIKADGGRFVSKNRLIRGNNKSIAYRFEGGLVESDKVAYRIYADHRGAVDIFGKTSDMFVWEHHTNQANHHTMQPWGRDLLHNGDALGIGGLAIGTDSKRFSPCGAPNIEMMVGSCGPIRANYRQVCKDIMYKGNKYDLIWDISISAGKRYLEHNVTVTKGGKLEMLAALTNHLDEGGVSEKISLNKAAELDWLGTFGKQVFADATPALAAKSKEEMGMAVLWPHKQLKTHLKNDLEFDIVFKPAKEIKYYSLAAYNGEYGTSIKTEDEFYSYVEQTAQCLQNPIIVKIKEIKTCSGL